MGRLLRVGKLRSMCFYEKKSKMDNNQKSELLQVISYIREISNDKSKNKVEKVQ